MDASDLVRENALLEARLAEVEATLAETQEANRRLQDILRAAQREMFGKRSEKLSPEQFNLPLEDAEFAQGVLEAAQEKAEAAMQRARGETPRKPKRNRGHLPPHLPRVERVIEPASTLCPCGCGEMAKIGEDVAERLDVIPAQLRVLSRAAQNMPAAAAHNPWHRHMPLSMSCPAACPRSCSSPGLSSRNSATTFRSTGRLKSSSGRASTLTGAPLATGSGARASI
jgi:hypothetical protein